MKKLSLQITYPQYYVTGRRIEKRGSEIGSFVSFTTSSVHLKAGVGRAALLAKAAALKQKQELERQEPELKAKREELELNTAIAALDAKLKVLGNFRLPICQQ